MIEDWSKFVTFDENKFGHVTFINDRAGKIKGKGTTSLNNGRGVHLGGHSAGHTSAYGEM